MVVEQTSTDQLGDAVSKHLAGLAQSLVNGDTKALREYLGVMARFHQYSLHNQMLIAVQNPKATKVAGYQVWKELGRQVKRGERGIRILAPLFRKQNLEEPSRAGEAQSILYGFKAVSVFDIAQTEGEPLPEYRCTLSSGAINPALLPEMVSRCPYPVHFEAMPGGQYGLTDGRVIAINSQHPEAEQLVSLLHEWTHARYHFCPEKPALQLRELEAEASAYVLATMLGLEARLACAEYLTGYQITPALLGGALRQVVQAVKEIGEVLGLELGNKSGQ